MTAAVSVLPGEARDFTCDKCAHLDVVHNRRGVCTAQRGARAGGRCACTEFTSQAADLARIEVLESRLAAVRAYLPELHAHGDVPAALLRPLYALTGPPLQLVDDEPA